MSEPFQPITAAELERWRGDVASLLSRHQRFAQMAVEDFARLLAAAEQQQQMEAELVSLLAFSGEILRRHRGDDPHDIGDVDGGTIQDAAVKFGLLESREVKEPCGVSCVCAEVGEFPRRCYFYSPLARKCMLENEF